ncbi:MAG: endolytic transglycosylase MltG, partial [Patescibacteria group bacterium]
RLQLTIIGIAVVCLGAIVFFLLPVDRNDVSLKTINVSRGAGLQDIAETLKQNDLIRSKLFFVLYIMAIGEQSNLKAGRYILSRGMPLPQVASKIVGGKALSEDVGVFIPEGYNVWEIDERLALVGLIKEGEFARRYHGQEGHFFPDTYRFSRGMSVQDIAERMENNFLRKAGYVGNEVLIIASLLEKEARREKDMGLVSGVIKNRLLRGMLLQIDASVIYGGCLRKYVATRFASNCDVTKVPVRAELAVDGDFNTYRRPGLPPQPIANPGLQSIKAARNPIASDYFYYLSTRDGSRIIFSKTGAEHVRYRAQYLGL